MIADRVPRASRPSSDDPRADLRVLPGLGLPRIGAAAALGLVLVPLGPGGPVVVAALAVGTLALLSVIDIRKQILPNRIVLPAAAFVLVGQVATRPERAREWILASLATSLALFVAAVAYRGGLGMGDVKLGLLLGAAVGKGVVLALAIAFLTAPIYAVVLIALHGRAARSMTMPFGPFLALGTITVLAAGATWHGLYG